MVLQLTFSEPVLEGEKIHSSRCSVNEKLRDWSLCGSCCQAGRSFRDVAADRGAFSRVQASSLQQKLILRGRRKKEPLTDLLLCVRTLRTPSARVPQPCKEAQKRPAGDSSHLSAEVEGGVRDQPVIGTGGARFMVPSGRRKKRSLDLPVRSASQPGEGVSSETGSVLMDLQAVRRRLDSQRWRCDSNMEGIYI